MSYLNPQLTCLLEGLIDRFGIQQTEKIFREILTHSVVNSKNVNHQHMVIDYLVLQAIEVFEVKDGDFYNSQKEEVRDARMACYYLLKLYTNITYKKAGEHFGTDKRSAMYYTKKCKEILEIPKFYKEFVNRYNLLERQLLAFITKIK